MSRNLHLITESREDIEIPIDVDDDFIEAYRNELDQKINQLIKRNNTLKRINIPKKPSINDIVEETKSSESSDSESKSIKSEEDISPKPHALANLVSNQRRSSVSNQMETFLANFTLRRPLRTNAKRRRSTLDANLLMHIKSLKAQNIKEYEQIEVAFISLRYTE